MSYVDPSQYSGGPSRGPQQPQGNSTLKVVLIVGGVVFGLGILVCGGFGFWAVKSFNDARAQFGEALLEELASGDGFEDVILADMIRDSEVVKGEVGDVQSVTMDLNKTAVETSEDDDFYWYKVVGSAGEAYVITDEGGDEDTAYRSCQIVLSNGERRDVVLRQLPYSEEDERAVFLAVRDDARFSQAVGTIQSVVCDWERTDAETDGDEADYWYRITGDRGVAWALTDESDEVVVTKVELPDKSTYSP